MSAMITATAWVPRGFAAQFPMRREFDEEEFERIAGLARGQLDDAREELAAEQDGEEEEIEGKNVEMEMEMDGDGGVKLTEEKKGGAETREVDDNDLREYDLDNYDNDDKDDAVVSDEGEPMGTFNSIKSLAYHQNGEDDPYITLKEDDGGEEKEELQVLGTDNLLLVAKTEDEVAQLEVYVYEDEADNFYVHHDIMLPAIPLCVEWLDVPVHQAGSNKPTFPPLDKDSRGNFCAIGTMDPDIEIWDLDVVDCMFPNAILGAGGADTTTDTPKKKKKKEKKSKKANDTHHVDSVLALAANRAHRNLLASASADKTVKLWDLNTTTCAKSYSHHTDKVCALAWHSKETTVLLSGSYDRTVVAADMRAPEVKAPRWGVESDVEGVRWDPHDPNYFYVSTESGVVHLHDARNAPSNPAETKPVWTLQAHDKACSAMDINPVIPGFIATGGFDKQVKLWNIAPCGSGPSLVISKDLDLGKVFSVGFGPDKEVGFRLAVAGSKGVVQVWDTSTNAAVRRVFAGRVPEVPEGKEEKMVRVQDDDEESDDEELEEGVNERDGWESMDE
ncbi:WD40 repeat-like protein [Terfezia boudieri ATCC MYA-4762]|uniref:WD40 repeat-like protein n=1 Tax=Terfezia boudieri ATCC MYA-4762 TaxID=1051890 RepID=A0A3N4LWA9_9PEZI|nr:WD40 repeat-like protein [Terfezia boudieri ATCC MYA-4762]